MISFTELGTAIWKLYFDFGKKSGATDKAKELLAAAERAKVAANADALGAVRRAVRNALCALLLGEDPFVLIKVGMCLLGGERSKG